MKNPPIRLKPNPRRNEAEELKALIAYFKTLDICYDLCPGYLLVYLSEIELDAVLLMFEKDGAAENTNNR